MGGTSDQLATRLFPPISNTYERGAHILSLGQDKRWRREMVGRLDLAGGGRVLDVAAGSGSITRLIAGQGVHVVSLDLSEPMLRSAVRRGAIGVVGNADRLPFRDAAFDALTFGYLLRYVGDVPACVRELARVLRPGGWMGMVEFGRPRGAWRPLWWLYTRLVLPPVGLAIGRGWWRVCRFLGPSIDDFADRLPPRRLAEVWAGAGIGAVRFTRPSLGGGLVMWGQKQ